jgi:hypothetical protein
VAMPFSDTASMQQGADTKSVEKGIDLSMDTNTGLSLGSNAANSHIGPFLLILFCFSQIQHYIKRLGLSTLFSVITACFPYFFCLAIKPES